MGRPLIDGKPCPRTRAIRWDSVRIILRARQDRRNALADGFIVVHAFASLPWCSPSHGYRLVETRISRDGTQLFAKVERHG